MEEDHSWMYRRTVPGFLDFEPDAAYCNYEEANNPEAQRIDVEVQEIRTLVHKLGMLESTEIHKRNSIGDEDEEEVEWESNDKEEEKEEEFQSESDFETWYVGDRKEGTPGDVYSSIGFYSSRDVCFSGYDVYTSGDLESISTVVVLESGDHFYFFFIICGGNIIDACPFIISISTCATHARFNKQSACAKSTTEIMKEHFVEAHASFGNIPKKNKEHVEVRADGYQPESKTSAQYMSLFDVWSSDAFKKKWEAAQRNRL
ncbi:hypothetical protein M9H77_23047 [Catharanthus roseus]|uniref:Uncharacterized protein n=1 Tax=Catharanthus roseus TaxID=4058 RepID=A0ACC0AT54_CATRO|nr:hypothetical protein M9H77_23047 [Catharanthus roseus]